MSRLRLIKPGTMVLLDGREVRIAQVSVMGDELCVQYQVVYWSDGERKTIWVFTNELDTQLEDHTVDCVIEEPKT